MNDQDRQAFEEERAFKKWAWENVTYPSHEAWAWRGWQASAAHRDAQHAEVMREVRELLNKVAEIGGHDWFLAATGVYVCCQCAARKSHRDAKMQHHEDCPYAAAARLREKVGEADGK